LDRKEALILASLKELGGDQSVCYCDCDAFWQSDPWSVLACFGGFGLAPDCGKRLLPRPFQHVLEHNSGVLLFNGEKEPMDADLIRGEYVRAWDDLLPFESGCPWLGQKVWSLIWARMRERGEANLLPKEMNWSHRWGANATAAVWHAHGGGKRSLANLAEIGHVPVLAQVNGG
jgi:hypothetical protein